MSESRTRGSSEFLLLVLLGVLTACNAGELSTDEGGSTDSDLVNAPIASLKAVDLPTKTTGGSACNGGCWLLWANGYVEGTVTFPTTGRYRFDITAYANLAAGLGADLELRIDGQTVASTTVGATTLAPLSLQANVSAGSHRVAIAFTNDYYDPAGGADRNLYIGTITISPVATVVASLNGATMTTKTGGSVACSGACWLLWSSGYVESTVTFPASGAYQFDVTAFADLALSEGANLELRIDQVALASVSVVATVPTHYTLQGNVTGGTHRVALAFTNDYYNAIAGADRNLYVGDVVVRTGGSTPTQTPSPSPTTPLPTPGACALSSRAVTPAIATKAAWDAKFDATYGTTLPNLSGGADSFAWHGHYWLRAYVSMAKTYGDTKYLDRAVTTIDYWFAHTEGAQGWGASLGPAQMMLDTGVIAQAIAIFAYEVWSDSRFAAYRPDADAYLAELEPILHSYDAQWVDDAPYPGSPGFYRYATCGGLCSPASLVMYNQGATMAKALLLIDRIYRLKGQTPDPGYLHKAEAAAAYFKTFVRQNGSAYEWDYGGARTNTGVEDTSHGHLDLSLVIWAKRFGLGGLTDADMNGLVGTLHKVLNGAAGANDVSLNVNGSGLAASDWDRVSVGYDWIELADLDPILFDKTVSAYNAHLANPAGSRFFLGWAEILRKRSCIEL